MTEGREPPMPGELLIWPMPDISAGPTFGFDVESNVLGSSSTVGEYAGGGVTGLNTNDSTIGGGSSKIDCGIFIGLYDSCLSLP